MQNMDEKDSDVDMIASTWSHLEKDYELQELIG